MINEMLAPRPAHEQRHARMIFEGTSIKKEANLCSCKQFAKKIIIRGKIKPLGFQRVGHENGHHGVTWLGHLVMPSGMGKCQFQHVLLHLKE
jgi:hypothetical protein